MPGQADNIQPRKHSPQTASHKLKAEPTTVEGKQGVDWNKQGTKPKKGDRKLRSGPTRAIDGRIVFAKPARTLPAELAFLSAFKTKESNKNNMAITLDQSHLTSEPKVLGAGASSEVLLLELKFNQGKVVFKPNGEEQAAIAEIGGMDIKKPQAYERSALVHWVDANIGCNLATPVVNGSYKPNNSQKPVQGFFMPVVEGKSLADVKRSSRSTRITTLRQLKEDGIASALYEAFNHVKNFQSSNQNTRAQQDLLTEFADTGILFSEDRKSILMAEGCIVTLSSPITQVLILNDKLHCLGHIPDPIPLTPALVKSFASLIFRIALTGEGDCNASNIFETLQTIDTNVSHLKHVAISKDAKTDWPAIDHNLKDQYQNILFKRAFIAPSKLLPPIIDQQQYERITHLTSDTYREAYRTFDLSEQEAEAGIARLEAVQAYLKSGQCDILKSEGDWANAFKQLEQDMSEADQATQHKCLALKQFRKDLYLYISKQEPQLIPKPKK